jgi:hypothetical protein
MPSHLPTTKPVHTPLQKKPQDPAPLSVKGKKKKKKTRKTHIFHHKISPKTLFYLFLHFKIVLKK